MKCYFRDNVPAEDLLSHVPVIIQETNRCGRKANGGLSHQQLLHLIFPDIRANPMELIKDNSVISGFIYFP